jgi:hypothetical protein
MANEGTLEEYMSNEDTMIYEGITLANEPKRRLKRTNKDTEKLQRRRCIDQLEGLTLTGLSNRTGGDGGGGGGVGPNIPEYQVRG